MHIQAGMQAYLIACLMGGRTGWSPVTALGIDAREAWEHSIDSIAKRNRYPSD